MSVLIDAAALTERRPIATEALAPLADALAAELDRLLPSGDPFIPAEKAKLTRAGGRCAADGALLEFDPLAPRRHRCPQCGVLYEGEEHYRWWIMGYQLWLAERAVHAAALWALRGDERHRQLAEGILGGLVERYPSYPNADNVLGPTRLFFSTYLESLWLVQLVTALDVLDGAGSDSAIGRAARERLVLPSAELIASYDEGDSNRQVWNNAAIAAAGRLLDRPEWVDRALFGPSGLQSHLANGLLADGTWFEGENYHLFAHRGLWYLVTLAERAGLALDSDLVRRFEEGFVTPFLTALPDFTFPSRRDSQYGVSLRQWRIAEMCELGLVRQADERLARALGELYRADIPSGDSARWRSTGDAERNVPAVRLSRADLGWKSLLFALPEPQLLSDAPAESALLEGQGLAVLRRRAGRVYVALDYGASGGGHGHPDRLNLWLVSGSQRVLEDVGTGSYVDRTLHWYRSTLAHNAPLVDGRSQPRVDGTLVAWEEGDGNGWVRAEAELASQVLVRRTVVVRPSYLVDVVQWEAPRPVTVDLPVHAEADAEPARLWEKAVLSGSEGEEDGFRFVECAERATEGGSLVLRAEGARGVIVPEHQAEWWRCLAPGPPGSRPRWFHLVRCLAARGRVVSAWAWAGDLRSVTVERDSIMVECADRSRDVHVDAADGWRVREHRGSATRDLHLGGTRRVVPRGAERSQAAIPPRPPARELPLWSDPPLAPGAMSAGGSATLNPKPLQFLLGRDHYRRSEPSWKDAGSPTALVSIAATPVELLVEVSVRKAALVFAPARDTNPLDNEHPDINSDGIQLHLARGGAGTDARSCAWLLVPDVSEPSVRVTPRSTEAAAIPVAASWRRVPEGYQLLLRFPHAACEGRTCRLDLVANDMAPDRERRRGQLVLSGARGEWVYLRGDRQDPARYLSFLLPDV